MPNTIQCDTHGESQETFVCSHLAEGAVGAGFNREEPSQENPFTDAWCDDCDVILETHQGWNEESEKLITIRLLCSGCYEKACIRNTRTDVSFDDLGAVRWKCSTCEEWHTGPCLDFGFVAPVHWTKDEKAKGLGDISSNRIPETFLNEDICAIDGKHFFIRGTIHLPIIGTAETFRWGVWGSLSKDNFEKLISIFDDPKRVELPPMFSWLSSDISDYPDTVNLKMYAHIQEPAERPTFELEPTDHPLSQEYYHGITPERVKEIMRRGLRETE